MYIDFDYSNKLAFYYTYCDVSYVQVNPMVEKLKFDLNGKFYVSTLPTVKKDPF